MSPKPLTKEQRRFIEINVERGVSLTTMQNQAVLADAAFWREAVKTADVCGEIGVPCPWCEARSYDPMVEAQHKATCVYRIAQEAE